MLNKRNLDDQTYQEIVNSAMGRLPWLCPVWTDHNAHDPGVTILELMVWYKEMQQYQLNQFTDGLKEKLLKLAGVRRYPASAAECALEISPEEPPRPALSRLETLEGIPFELAEDIPAQRPRIRRVRAGEAELWETLSGGLTFQPFGAEGKETLRIGLEQPEGAPLKLWFQVAPPPPPLRNPFLRPDQRPRELRWILEGFGPVEPLEDGTHALSRSGTVSFPPCPEWTAGEDGLHWLRVELADPGCEETVRLSGLSVSRYPAVQRETWAQNYTFSVPPEPWEAFVPGAMARDSELAVFVRQRGQWEQTTGYEMLREPGGLRFRLNGLGADQDGEDNVLLVCLDREHLDCLLFDTVGLPGERLLMDLEERRILDIFLLCQTLDRDGKVRLHPWRWVDDLAPCGPRDRVFTYDARRRTLLFGNGEQGAVVQAGQGSVLVTSLRLTLGRDGNIPAKAGLRVGVARVIPVYEDVDMSIALRTQGAPDRREVRQLVEGYLSPENMGGPLRAGELAVRLQAMPGVLQVKRLDLRALGSGCYQDAAGDIHMSPIAIPVLRRLELEETPFFEGV